MKKVVTTIMLLVGMTLMAQEHERHLGNAMKDLTPEQMATLHTKKMTLALDLSDAQRAQLKELFTENAKARMAKMEARKTQRESGEMKKPTPEERYTMQNEHLDRLIAQKAEMKKILSKEQFEKWEKMEHSRRHHRHQDEKDGNHRPKHQKERK